MKITNNSNLPEALTKLVRADRHNEPGEISATTLLKGAREVVLLDRHWDELEDDVRNRIWAIFGSSVHYMLQHESPDEFAEVLLKYKPGDVMTVTGQIDNYNMKTKTITDYKTASVWKWKFKDFNDWMYQGLVYAWLLRNNGFEVDKIQFVAFLKDFSERDAERDSEYPQSPAMVYEVSMSYYDKLPNYNGGINDWIIDKLKKYVNATNQVDNELPDCTASETWAKPAKYAVMKQGRKTALRVFDSKKEAELFLEGLGDMFVSIEYRPGERPKCERYCLAAPFCNTYKNFMEEYNNDKSGNPGRESIGTGKS